MCYDSLCTGGSELPSVLFLLFYKSISTCDVIEYYHIRTGFNRYFADLCCSGNARWEDSSAVGRGAALEFNTSLCGDGHRSRPVVIDGSGVGFYGCHRRCFVPTVVIAGQVEGCENSDAARVVNLLDGTGVGFGIEFDVVISGLGY